MMNRQDVRQMTQNVLFVAALTLVLLALPYGPAWGDNLGPLNSDCIAGAAPGCPNPYPYPPAVFPSIQGRDNACSVLVGGGFTVLSGAVEAEGRVVILGNFSALSGAPYSMGWVGAGSFVIPDDDTSDESMGADDLFDWVIVGGATSIPASFVTLGGGPFMLSGDFRHVGPLTGTVFVNPPQGNVISDPGFDLSPFTATLAAALERSLCWGSQPSSANGEVEFLGTEIVFRSTDGASGLYVFNLDRDLDDDAGNPTPFIFENFPDDATLLINIDKPGSGDTVAILTGTFLDETAAEISPQLGERILWNLPDATTVLIGTDSQFRGSILVPRTDATTTLDTSTNGRLLIGGNLIQGDRSGGLEIHNYPFRGDLPVCRPPVPATEIPTLDPLGLLLLTVLLAAASLFLLARRRQRA